jgi:hypothetical protein
MMVNKRFCRCDSLSEVNAAGRVFRVWGSSFQEKMSLAIPKKRPAPKKRLFIAIKKKGARAPCNRLARMSEVNAAGRVFRV